MSQQNIPKGTWIKTRNRGRNEPGTKPGGLFGVRVDHANRELYVSTTRAVAGVSLASFCGLLIGVMALSRHATHTGPQGGAGVGRNAAAKHPPPAETAPVVVVEQRP